MNPTQFRTDILKPALKYLGVDFMGESAERLLMGTAAQESGFKYIRQLNGPALGFFQMEPATLEDLYDNYLSYRPTLLNHLEDLRGRFPSRSAVLQSNLYYAVATCRLQYYRVPAPLPDDLNGIAEYWKEHWNTHLGKGTVDQFLDNYARYVDD